jgi:AcrR family transcriptional regulator
MSTKTLSPPKRGPVTLKRKPKPTPHRTQAQTGIIGKKGVASKATPKKAAPAFSFPDALSVTPVPTSAREKILHAAMEVLNNEGFGGLTQTRVAQVAGVRQSHITYYFPARNDLLRETAVYGCNVMLGALSVAIDTGELDLANFREVMTTDIHDRRFARLMCALIVASDEDDRIKPWLASFEAANLERLQQNFQKLGLPVTLDEVAFFHATYVGSVMLDLGESTSESLLRGQRKVTMAFDVIATAAQTRASTASKRYEAANKATSKATSKVTNRVTSKTANDAVSKAKTGIKKGSKK